MSTSFVVLKDIIPTIPPLDSIINEAELQVVYQALDSLENRTRTAPEEYRINSDNDDEESTTSYTTEDNESILSIDSYHSLYKELPDLDNFCESAPLEPVIDLPNVFEGEPLSDNGDTPPPTKRMCLRSYHPADHTYAAPSRRTQLVHRMPDLSRSSFLSCLPFPAMGTIYTYYLGLVSLPYLGYAEMLGPCTACIRTGNSCSEHHFTGAFQVPYWWRVRSPGGFLDIDAPGSPSMFTTNAEYQRISWAYSRFITHDVL